MSKMLDCEDLIRFSILASSSSVVSLLIMFLPEQKKAKILPKETHFTLFLIYIILIEINIIVKYYLMIRNIFFMMAGPHSTEHNYNTKDVFKLIPLLVQQINVSSWSARSCKTEIFQSDCLNLSVSDSDVNIQ